MHCFSVSNDEVLVGLDDAKGVSEKISEAIKTNMDPAPQVILEIHAEDGKEFVVLRVLSGQETPYYYTGDGNRIAYVRIGNESVPASAVDLKRLVLRGSNTSFDSLSTRYSFESLAFTKLRSVYRMRTGTELTDSDFVSFELVDENNMLTNAGVLLADESPIRHSRLFCTRWYGLDKASGIMEALDDKEYSGSLVSLLQNGTEFVKNNTKKRWKKTGNGRVEMPEYPEQAVHEVIVNALIHRDYMEIGSEVHIDIFDDRMEVYSPGGMFDGSIVQELDTDNVASKRRNPVIADIFSRMHFNFSYNCSSRCFPGFDFSAREFPAVFKFAISTLCCKYFSLPLHFGYKTYTFFSILLASLNHIQNIRNSTICSHLISFMFFYILS